MLIIVGLGNPGLKYNKTRHNAGFDTIDLYAKDKGIKISKRKCKALIGEGNIKGQKVVLVKPQTFMNNSGEAVSQVLDMFKASPEDDLLILSDDLTLDCGNLRIRRKGSAGGHNGLKSVIQMTGTDNFARIRIGVGKVPEDSDIITHVLTRMSRVDRLEAEKSFEVACQAIDYILDKSEDFDSAITEAQSRFNGKC